MKTDNGVSIAGLPACPSAAIYKANANSISNNWKLLCILSAWYAKLIKLNQLNNMEFDITLHIGKYFFPQLIPQLPVQACKD